MRKPRTRQDTNGLSSYTLTFERDFWHQAKIVATLRKKNLREYMRWLIQRDIKHTLKGTKIPTRLSA